MTRCTFDENRDGHPCGRALNGGVWCPVHDRTRCYCGIRILDGKAVVCPNCGRSVQLKDTLKGQ